MENFSSPQSKARKKYSSGFFNSSSAIDRDVTVFILKCWTKQIDINLQCANRETVAREKAGVGGVKTLWQQQR